MIEEATRAVMQHPDRRMQGRRARVWKRQLRNATTFWEWFRANCHLTYLKYGPEISITEFHYQLQRTGELQAAYQAGRAAQWKLMGGDDPD